MFLNIAKVIPTRYKGGARWGWAVSLFLGVALVAGLSACGGKSGQAGSGESGDDQDFLNQLTLFVENIQADRIDKAMKMLSPEEQGRFGTDANPESLPRRLSSLRLSTLARRPGVRLGPKGLEGIYDELPWLGGARTQELVPETGELGEPEAIPEETETPELGTEASPWETKQPKATETNGSENQDSSYEGMDESEDEIPLPMP
jgi:hypothetical protein